MAEPAAPALNLALFGKPVAHSLSPHIHQAFAEQTGQSVRYTAHEAGPKEFSAVWQAFVASGGHGANITLPLKQEAMAMADHLHPSGRQASAINTLVRQGDDWHGHNTDGAGLLADLDRLNIELAEKAVLILGAGGAVAGLLGPVLERQPQQLLITNRTFRKACLLCELHEADSLAALPWEEIYDLEHIDLLINATAMGHEGTAPQIPIAGFNEGAQVYDLNYGKAAEPLAQTCARKTITYHSGLGMLVAQAAESFRLWTGQMPDWSSVLEALLSEA